MLPWRHFLLALAVVAIWGTNFVVIHEGLQAFPPIWFAQLRFLLAAFPAILFLPRPRTRWRTMAGFGLFMGVIQFGLLFCAMKGRIEPGLASLVIQTQVFFTIGLSVLSGGETLSRNRFLALVLCAAGLAWIIAGTGGASTAMGVGMVLAAAMSWALGNLVVRAAGEIRMLDFIVWGSAFAVPPLLALALVAEGPAILIRSMETAGAAAWLALAWQALGNTLFGFGAWNWLLSRHPPALVTPMALLVPLFGLSASAIVLAEPMPMWKIGGGTLILVGLALILLPSLLSRANRNAPSGAAQ